jgi:hypothetical protein
MVMLLLPVDFQFVNGNIWCSCKTGGVDEQGLTIWNLIKISATVLALQDDTEQISLFLNYLKSLRLPSDFNKNWDVSTNFSTASQYHV